MTGQILSYDITYLDKVKCLQNTTSHKKLPTAFTKFRERKVRNEYTMIFFHKFSKKFFKIFEILGNFIEFSIQT